MHKIIFALYLHRHTFAATIDSLSFFFLCYSNMLEVFRLSQAQPLSWILFIPYMTNIIHIFISL